MVGATRGHREVPAQGVLRAPSDSRGSLSTRHGAVGRRPAQGANPGPIAIRDDLGDKMNIAILGAGAMGSAIGALLRQAGHDVTLIDVWREAVEAINRDGLKIHNKAGEITTCRVRAVHRPTDVAGPVDLLLVFVKCYDTVEAVRSALPILAPASTVLSLQNG